MRGTVQKINETTYRLYVSGGFDYRGKRVRFSKTFHGTKAQADKELSLFLAQCERGLVNKGTSITLEQFCTLWLDECTINLKESTRSGYVAIIRSQFAPISKRKLSSIKPIHIQQFVNDTARTHSPKTVRNIYSLLRTIMGKAVLWGYISNNPCDNIELPRPERHEAESYTRDEVVTLVTSLLSSDITKENIKVAILLMLYCGLRRGEVLGLNVEDVDYTNSSISVKRTRIFINGKGLIEDTPKTASSIRSIGVPDIVMNELKVWKKIRAEWQLRVGSSWGGSKALIVNELGEPLHPDYLRKEYKKAIDDCNIRYLSMHKLRHTQASMLVELGVPINVVSKRLGHSQISTTTNIYTHLFENSDKAVTEALDNFTNWHETGTENK